MTTLSPIKLRIGTMLLVLELFFLFSFATNKYEALAAISPGGAYLVMIDPGHGGIDKGAKGVLREGKRRQQIFEKDITLGIAIRLQRVLSDPKYWKALGRPIRVLLTREKDVNLSLSERTKMAKRFNPDLFLSIHANSERTGKVSGVETFFLNNTDSESTRKIAEIQNRKRKRGELVNDVDLVMEAVTSDSTVGLSKQAAEIIHKSAMEHLENEDVPVSNRGVKHSMLYVLLDNKVPAVLFESLYMSNINDLLFLNTADNRQKIAEGLAKGVLRFLALK